MKLSEQIRLHAEASHRERFGKEAAGRKAGEQFLTAHYGTATEQLIKDGLRYRHLREVDCDALRKGLVCVTALGVVLNGEDLDRAVNLAMGVKSAEQCCGDSGDCGCRNCPKARA
ncbi:MAG TPA: hypothetical protein PL193_07760 [Xanthobacteraceae bacterium]|nr:hypothetical protein [Xanthobacteraceae bacterium]